MRRAVAVGLYLLPQRVIVYVSVMELLLLSLTFSPNTALREILEADKSLLSLRLFYRLLYLLFIFASCKLRDCLFSCFIRSLKNT